MCARSVLVALIVAASAWACGARADQRPPQTTQTVVWRQLGSWSGHGNRQTESFHGETGALRVKWEARPESADGTAGPFRLTAHSAISGRVLAEVVDRQGAGSGVGYVSTEPHTFYISVESTGLAWTFSVDEGFLP